MGVKGREWLEPRQRKKDNERTKTVNEIKNAKSANEVIAIINRKASSGNYNDFCESLVGFNFLLKIGVKAVFDGTKDSPHFSIVCA